MKEIMSVIDAALRQGAHEIILSADTPISTQGSVALRTSSAACAAPHARFTPPTCGFKCGLARASGPHATCALLVGASLADSDLWPVQACQSGSQPLARELHKLIFNKNLSIEAVRHPSCS